MDYKIYNIELVNRLSVWQYTAFKEGLIKCVFGILREFHAIILLRFLEINTIIPAKSRRILA